MPRIYLATDPDREGEAIAWHLLEAAKIDPKRTQRVVFHEITEPAIADAFAHPREINMDLVNAQQARRVLDRLVGYNISPLLWRKVRSRLSAGRVQSVALRLIVEREREIDAFNPVEYWSIAAELRPEKVKETFIAKLAKMDGEDPVLGNRSGGPAHPGGHGKRQLCHHARSSAASAGANRPRPSPPAPCSRKPPAAWATPPGAPWPWPSSCTKASTWAKAARRPDHLHAYRLDQRGRDWPRTKRASLSASAMARSSCRPSRPNIKTKSQRRPGSA